MLNKKVELKWFYLSDRFYLILWADQKFDISSFIWNASFHVIVIHRLKVMHAGRLANDCHSSTNTSQPNSEYDRKINTHKNPIKHLLNDTHTHTHTLPLAFLFVIRARHIIAKRFIQCCWNMPEPMAVKKKSQIVSTVRTKHASARTTFCLLHGVCTESQWDKCHGTEWQSY